MHSVQSSIRGDKKEIPVKAIKNHLKEVGYGGRRKGRYLPQKFGPVDVTSKDVNVGDIALWRAQAASV